MTTREPTSKPAAAEAARQAAYVAEASGDLVAMSFPGARRVAGWLFWVVFPLFSIVSLVYVVIAFATHIGEEPDGYRGTFTAARSCSRGVCIVGGTFTSDDGSVRNETLIGDPRWRTGEQHRVVWNPKGVEVTSLGTWDPTVSVIAGVAAVSYLAAVGYFARGMRRDPSH